MTARPPHLPRAILFDMDETILSAYGGADAAWLQVATEFAAALGALHPDVAARMISHQARLLWADSSRHKHWRLRLREARREIVRAAFLALAHQGHGKVDDAVALRLADRFTDLREEATTCFPGALETIDTLKAMGVRLALVTNGAREPQRAKIERFDLASRFQHIQIEGEHGFGKPEEQAYIHAMQALDVGPADTWMVGDNLEWEVVAPQRLGIYAIWHDVVGEGLPTDSPIRPDRIIRALPELLTPIS